MPLLEINQERARSYINSSLNAYLKSAVYGGDSLFDLYKLPLLFGLISPAIQGDAARDR